MKILQFIKTRAFRFLSNCEFEFFGNNSNNYFRLKYAKSLGIDFQLPFSMGKDIYVRDFGNIKVGKNCSLGSFTKIWNYGNIEIGNHFLSAGNLTINTGTHDPITLIPSSKSIKIGDRVWIGLNVTILAGVVIGNDVVVAAGSIVTKDIPSNTLVGGVPAKKIKEIDRSSLPSIWGAWGGIKI